MGQSSHYPELYRNDDDWEDAYNEMLWEQRRRRMLEDARMRGEPAPENEDEA